MKLADTLRFIQLAGLLVLASCSRDASETLGSAKSYLAKNDLPAAAIELKNLLQGDPSSGEARFLLGRVLLEQGDAKGAEIELRRAQEARYPESELAPLMARAMVAMGENQQVVERFEKLVLPQAEADADLRTAVAKALLALGRPGEATATVEQALARSPRSVAAVVLRARLHAASGDIDSALTKVASLLESTPGNAEAWRLKGQLLWLGKSDQQGAEQAFRKALELRADQPDAHVALISMAFSRRDPAAVAGLIAAMQKAFPNDPQAKLFEARLAYVQGEHKRARELLLPILQGAPRHVAALYLAGANELALQSPQSAESRLLTAVRLAPDFGAARRLLAQVYLQMRQPAKAMDTLRPMLDKGIADSEVLAQAGQAMLMLGDSQASDAFFTRAAKLRPDDVRLRAVAAVRQLALGFPEAGFGELQSIAATDKGTSIDLALISALLKRADLDAALKAIDALQRKQPESPLAPNLRARALLVRQDRVGARKGFEQALARDPHYLPALNGLAALDLAERRPDASRARFEALVKGDPRNVQLLLSYAEFTARSGAPSEKTSRLIQDAVMADPNDPAPRMALIDRQLADNDTKGALATAQAAVNAIPGNNALLERLARLQLAAGMLEQARSAFSTLATQSPDSATAYLGLAQLRLVEQDLPGAEREARRALQHDPDSWPARRMLISLVIRQQRPDDAIKLAREQQKRRPDDAMAFTTEGELEASQQHWGAAISALRAAIAKAQPGNAPARLHAVLLMAGRADEAARFAVDWGRAHPKDTAFYAQLGDAALARKDYPQAEKHYLRVIGSQPTDVPTLNNLAWLLARQNKAGGLAYMERALAITPGSPATLDTYASVLAADRQLPKALEVQKQVVAKAPKVPIYRMNLARLYLQAGDKAMAATELGRLSAVDEGSLDPSELAQLRKAIAPGP